MRGDVLKGHLPLLLLASIGSQAAHGYEIIERLRLRSGDAFDLPEGTIYPALHRLERDGLLKSRRQEVSGRARRVYELTARGREALDRQRFDWRAFADAVRLVIERAT
jgi:DNA-binding PadR family transcriptional regulator